MKKVLVIAVHPDDETLGAGGTLLKHKANGDQIYWLIITNVLKEHGFSDDRINSRQSEIEEVAKLYGFEEYFKLDFPTTKLDEISRSTLIKSISDIINKLEPNIIYLPHRGDVHSDHRIVFEAAYSCTKNFRYPFIEKLLMMETLSETEFSPALIETTFIPNVFYDISDFMEDKLRIMAVFESELMMDNGPRSYKSIKALSSLRGSRIGVEYAESFMLLLEIDS